MLRIGFRMVNIVSSFLIEDQTNQGILSFQEAKGFNVQQSFRLMDFYTRILR